MKLSYCCLHPPHSLLLACCALLCVGRTATAVTAATLDDVPGCACQADTTCESRRQSQPRPPTLCDFVEGFGDVQNAPVPICDGLEADSEFLETFGDKSNTYSTRFGGATTAVGPYYESGPLVYRIDYGTCDDLYYHSQPQKSSWCPTTSNFRNITDEESVSEEERGAVLMHGFSRVGPGSAGSTASNILNYAPNSTDSVLQVHFMCESSSTSDRASAIIAGHEDNLFLVVSIGPEVNPNDDYEWIPEVDTSRPTLTNKDWIKPVAGSSRRYMTHDIVDVENAREYCILFAAIGNEHCSGPPPPSTTTTTSLPDPLPDPPSSSTNGNYRHASMLLVSSIVGTFVVVCIVFL